jgi:hypothetical protein
MVKSGFEEEGDNSMTLDQLFSSIAALALLASTTLYVCRCCCAPAWFDLLLNCSVH